jgi:hypothetical protein
MGQGKFRRVLLDAPTAVAPEVVFIISSPAKPKAGLVRNFSHRCEQPLGQRAAELIKSASWPKSGPAADREDGNATRDNRASPVT